MGGTVRSQERMRLLLILLPRLSLSTCQAFAPGDNCDEWKVGNLWQVGYDASLVFTVDHKVTSWTIHLEFESPLEGLDCYIAKASSSDNVHWDITSFDWDGPQDVGDQLEIGFQVHFSGDPPDLIYADFDGPDHPICGSSGPTDPPTTEPTTPGTTPTTETSTEPATTSSTTTTTASTTGPTIECPDGWVASDDSRNCFLFIASQPGNWAEGHLACEAVGGFMAEPKTKQLAEQLASLAFEESDANEVSYWWLGLTDWSHEDRWVWQHSIKDASFTSWALGAPAIGENFQDCALMALEEDFLWLDKDCLETQAGIICQQGA